MSMRSSFSAVRCSKRANLAKVCGNIAGDANLYTLFRVDGRPIECPFGKDNGFTFSYNRGKGECSWPESQLEPCTDPESLVLHYQACPNVQGSELMSKYWLLSEKSQGSREGCRFVMTSFLTANFLCRGLLAFFATFSGHFEENKFIAYKAITKRVQLT